MRVEDMGHKGRGYKRLVVLGLALAALTVAVLIAVSPFLGVDWIPLATAVVSLFLAFLMLIAVYVAVDQLRISVESSENVGRQLVDVGNSLTSLYDLMAEQAGEVPELTVFFTDDSDRLDIRHGEGQLPIKIKNNGSMRCRKAIWDLYFPIGIQILDGEFYKHFIVRLGKHVGKHKVRVELPTLEAGYHRVRVVNVRIPVEAIGEQTIDCIMLGENCKRAEKELKLIVFA